MEILLKDRNATIVLAGSHIGMMVELMGYHAPLYGRFTAQLPVDPLPFPVLRDFLPRYPAAERGAALQGLPVLIIGRGTYSRGRRLRLSMRSARSGSM